MAQINIRKWQKDDIPEVLNLIKDLAIYEKEPNAVHTTEEDLLRDGFSDNPFFHCIVGELNGKVEGFALYFFTWSTWEGRPSLYLEDLFVREEKRGNSLGLKLFKQLAVIACEQDCNRFEWAVLDWNQLARDFYHGLGAYHKNGWLPYRMDKKAMEDLAR